MFDGARVGEIGRREIDAAVGLFDDETANVAISKFDGERQPDRAGAGDENGNAWLLLLFVAHRFRCLSEILDLLLSDADHAVTETEARSFVLVPDGTSSWQIDEV